MVGDKIRRGGGVKCECFLCVFPASDVFEVMNCDELFEVWDFIRVWLFGLERRVDGW